MLVLKRAYEKASAQDGVRFLVDRLWPRGVRKADLRIDGWLKDAAPSDALRRWFAHDPERWSEFRRRYFAELDQHAEACAPLRQAVRQGRVTLVYSAKDAEHNNAAALRDYLAAGKGRGKKTSHA